MTKRFCDGCGDPTTLEVLVLNETNKVDVCGACAISLMAVFMPDEAARDVVDYLRAQKTLHDSRK